MKVIHNMGYINDLATAFMEFTAATGINPCVSFAGACLIIAGLVSLKDRPWQKSREAVTNAVAERERWWQHDELWTQQVAPTLEAVGLIVLGVFSLWLATVPFEFEMMAKG